MNSTATAIIAPFSLLALAACAHIPAPVREDGATEVRMNQWANVGGPRVRVLRVREDSRCPMEARCVWAGRVVLDVEVALGRGRQQHELSSESPLQIADGALELVGTMPPTSVQRAIAPRDYRFALKFSGGI